MLHANGISRPRTVERLVNEKKWRSDFIEGVKVVPWGEEITREEDADQNEKDPSLEMEGVPLEKCEEGPPEQRVQDHQPAIRGLYLRRADFNKHGWTEKCAKCRFMILHPSREGGPIHNDDCKTRIMNKLKETAEGRRRVEQAEQRQTECMARQLHRTSPLDEPSMRKDEIELEKNDRAARLDHDDADGAQWHHEDEMNDDKPEASKANTDGDEAMYDLFVGNAGMLNSSLQ